MVFLLRSSLSMELYYTCLCWITFIAAIEGKLQDPCGSIRCERDYQECRLLEVTCPVGEPCQTEPMCFDKQVVVTSCRYGYPVMKQVGTDRYTTPRCRSSSQCPDNTECYEAQGTASVCCWTPYPVERQSSAPTLPLGLERHCAKNFPLPSFFCNWMVPLCQLDSDCAPGLKCCHTERCGRKGCLLARLQKECSFFDKFIGIC